MEAQAEANPHPVVHLAPVGQGESAVEPPRAANVSGCCRIDRHVSSAMRASLSVVVLWRQWPGGSPSSHWAPDAGVFVGSALSMPLLVPYSGHDEVARGLNHLGPGSAGMRLGCEAAGCLGRAAERSERLDVWDRILVSRSDDRPRRSSPPELRRTAVGGQTLPVMGFQVRMSEKNTSG